MKDNKLILIIIGVAIILLLGNQLGLFSILPLLEEFTWNGINWELRGIPIQCSEETGCNQFNHNGDIMGWMYTTLYQGNDRGGGKMRLISKDLKLDLSKIDKLEIDFKNELSVGQSTGATSFQILLDSDLSSQRIYFGSAGGNTYRIDRDLVLERYKDKWRASSLKFYDEIFEIDETEEYELDFRYDISDTNPVSISYEIYDIRITYKEEDICNTNADTNCDGIVDRDELGVYIIKWIDNQISRDELGEAIQAWI